MATSPVTGASEGFFHSQGISGSATAVKAMRDALNRAGVEFIDENAAAQALG